MTARSTRGERVIAAEDNFFAGGGWTTTLAEDEEPSDPARAFRCLRPIPATASTNSARAGDYAIAMALATFCIVEGVIAQPRMTASAGPVRAVLPKPSV